MTRTLSIFALLLAAPLAAQEAPRSISVSGTAEIRVVPDEVILSLGVQTYHADLDTAKQENDARMARVLAVAREAEVPDERLATDYIRISPVYEFNNGRQRHIDGYSVDRGLEIRLRDLDRFEDLLTDALASGANVVHGITFRTTELREHRDEARGLALDAAREKATDMAERLGQSLGDVLSIAEGSVGWSSGYGWRGGAGMQNVVQVAGDGSGASGPTTPGQIEVTARVSVTFALVD